MNGIVMKFGGSSVADAACMRRVAELVRAASHRSPLVVLSAMGKTTNGLFTAARAAESGRLDAALESMHAVMSAHLKAARELFPDGHPEPDTPPGRSITAPILKITVGESDTSCRTEESP